MDDAAIHRVSEEGDRVMRFAYWFTVDRHRLSALAMTRCIVIKDTVRSLHAHSCHCEEDRMDDAAIHRVSGEGDRMMRFACWFTVDRHGLSALAMTI